MTSKKENYITDEKEGKKGLLSCIDYWKENHEEAAVLGVFESQDSYENDIYVYEENGLKIAILNYTYGTNGIPLPADLVIGTHPHYIQPVEMLMGENGKEMLVYYSLGNFINISFESMKLISCPETSKIGTARERGTKDESCSSN